MWIQKLSEQDNENKLHLCGFYSIYWKQVFRLNVSWILTIYNLDVSLTVAGKLLFFLHFLQRYRMHVNFSVVDKGKLLFMQFYNINTVFFAK